MDRKYVFTGKDAATPDDFGPGEADSAKEDAGLVTQEQLGSCMKAIADVFDSIKPATARASLLSLDSSAGDGDAFDKFRQLLKKEGIEA